MMHVSPCADDARHGACPKDRFRRAALILLVGLLSHSRDARGVTRPRGQDPPTPPPVVVAEGQVTNYVGGGEEGAEVTLHRRNPDGSLGEPLAATKTDGMGDFQLTATAPLKGDAVVRIIKSGYAVQLRDVTLGEGEHPPFVDVTLEGEHVLSGKVSDARDGAPLVGAEVRVRTPFREWNEKTREGGRFRVEKLSPGDVEVVVQAKGFGREMQRIEILPDGNEIELVLKPERVVRLRVVDESGKPVAGAVVDGYDKQRDDFRNTITDAEGKAVLSGVHFDTEGFALRVHHADFVRDTDFSRHIDLPPGVVESSHELRLTRAGRVVGQVIDAATRKPLSDARLIAGPQVSDFAPQTFTDVEGQFTLKGLPSGETLVTVYRPGSAPELVETRVAAGEEQSILIKLGAPRDVTGAVLDATDKPVPRAFIETRAWRGHDTLTLRTMTDDHGRFTLLDAPPDEFEIVATSQENVRGRAKAPPGGAAISISLTEAVEQPKRGGGKVAEGTAAPLFQVTSLDGKALTLAELKGKTVLLDFWATWCGPCVAEVPNLVKVHEAFAARKDFVMISISLDRDESALKRFVDERKMAWNHVFGEKGGADAAADQYGVAAIPALFLIDREGKVVASDLRGGEIMDRLKAVLEPEKP